LFADEKRFSDKNLPVKRRLPVVARNVMSKKKRKDNAEVVVLGLNESPQSSKVGVDVHVSRTSESRLEQITGHLKAHWIGAAAVLFVLFVGLGVMAKNGWLPQTDPKTGKRTGWFGAKLQNQSASSWNPFAPPPPSPTPVVAKEYIYAGGRLLAFVETGASEIPPADLAVWRPSNRTWRIFGVSAYTEFGETGDIPVQGDYDGDGKTDFSVFNPTLNRWRVLYSSDNSEHFHYFGSSGDIPKPADFDGDGKTDVAVWRPSNQYWYILPSSTNTMTSFQYGLSGDQPVPADFDGDGKADVTVWRSSDKAFYWQKSSDGQFGSSSVSSAGTPVNADYDGDGKADAAVLSGNNWIIRTTSTNTESTIPWQTSGFGGTPVPNDYDGDGKVDIAIWRVGLAKGNPATWFIRKSSDLSLRQENWGTLNDIPVPAYYRR